MAKGEGSADPLALSELGLGQTSRGGLVQLNASSNGLLQARAVPARNYRLIALIVACAMFMEAVDITVLGTTLPTMARGFGVRAASTSIALTSYLLALAIFIPASGRIADRFGSRTIFCTAMAIFVAGSILCGQATGLTFMVAARFIQGIGGAMMTPVGRLLLIHSVDKRDMVSAISWLVAPALIGPVIGPPLGGSIVTYLDWRWIFYFNVPIEVLGIVLAGLFFENSREPQPSPPDFLGFALSGAALSCLLFGFEFGGRGEDLRLVFGLLGAGAVFSMAYLGHTRRRLNAILDFSLMRFDSFRLAVIARHSGRASLPAAVALPARIQVQRRGERLAHHRRRDRFDVDEAGCAAGSAPLRLPLEPAVLRGARRPRLRLLRIPARQLAVASNPGAAVYLELLPIFPARRAP